MAGEPIVQFFIQNYLWNGSVVGTETCFQTIPYSGEPAFTSGKVKCEMGKAGSFEFGMEMTSPYYNALMQMKTLMRVTYFGHTIFRGRVLTIDKTLTRSRTVHCEGDFAFLLDSHQVGAKEDNRPEIGVMTYLNQIINQHNADMGDDNQKKFTLGTVTVPFPADKATQQFGDTGWDTSMDRIESLLNDFGGYFRTRYDDSQNPPVVYLDWYENYYNGTTNAQAIEVTKNLIDISGSTEVENLFTVVIPIGKNDNENVYIGDYWPIVSGSHAHVDYITVPELATVPLYSDQELNANYHRKEDYQNAITRFGKIWKTVEFENANTPEKLFTYAKDWMKNNFMPELTQWDVTALDLKIIDSNKQVLLCGDRVVLQHPEVDQRFGALVVISAEYDLFNPDKNKYTIGIPNQQINAAYGVKIKQEKEKKVSSKTGKSGSSAGISAVSTKSPSVTQEARDQVELLRNQLQQLYSLKTDFKQDITLDNPMAFLLYNTDGSEKTRDEVIHETATSLMEIIKTKNTLGSVLIAQEAKTRGVDKNDPQLLIDLSPTLKAQQTEWKSSMSTTLSSYGFTNQQIEVLLNEEGNPLLASYVDDNGNWSQFALSQGIHLYAKAEEIRQLAITNRLIMSGKYEPENADVLTDFKDTLLGGNLNIGDFFTVDVGDTLSSLGFGDLFNIDISDTLSSLGFGDLLNVDQLKDSANNTISNVVNFVSGLFSGSKTQQTSGGTTTTTATSGSFMDGLITGTKDAASSVVNLISGLFSGSTSSSGNSVLSMINNLFSGSSSNGGNSQSFSFLSGLIDGAKSAGQKSFDFLHGLFSGDDKNGNGKEFSLTSDSCVVDGIYGGAGFGAVANNGKLNGWTVTLNKPITYTAQTGTNDQGQPIIETFTVPSGAVAADDIHVTATYDSLRAKLAVVDVLLADYAQINTLRALKASIDSILTTTVNASVNVSAGYVYANHVTGYDTVTSTDVVYKSAISGTGPSIVTAHLQRCFDDAAFSEGSGSNAGKILLTLYAADDIEAHNKTISFNIASTQKYIDGVDAARRSVYITDITASGGYTTKYKDENDVEHLISSKSGVTVADGYITNSSAYATGVDTARKSVYIKDIGASGMYTTYYTDSSNVEHAVKTYTSSNVTVAASFIQATQTYLDGLDTARKSVYIKNIGASGGYTTYYKDSSNVEQAVKTYGGGNVTVDDAFIANTTKYTTDVAAARNTGRSDIYVGPSTGTTHVSSITANGTYYTKYNTEVDGETVNNIKKSFTVNVPQPRPNLVYRSFTSNGTYYAERTDNGADGYYAISVSVNASCSHSFTTKHITSNGTYSASSDGVSGYSSVSVNVSGGGGGAGSITIPASGIGTASSQPNGSYHATTIEQRVQEAWYGHTWVKFTVSCSCGASSRTFAFKPN